MLNGKLKFTGAEQRTDERARQDWRIGWWVWVPTIALGQLVLWAVTYLQFAKGSPFAWVSLGLSLLTTIGGIQIVKRHY